MPLFSAEEARARATRAKSAAQILALEGKAYIADTVYDIFFSHSYQDAEVILGVKLEIEELGYKVYVDWVEDPEYDRNKITEAVALRLKLRMSNSKSLFFLASEKSGESKWMPWELGYFDGLKDKVAVLPVVKEKSSSNYYHGQEYLGIYPYVTRLYRERRGTLYIHKGPLVYVPFDRWLKGEKPSL